MPWDAFGRTGQRWSRSQHTTAEDAVGRCSHEKSLVHTPGGSLHFCGGLSLSNYVAWSVDLRVFELDEPMQCYLPGCLCHCKKQASKLLSKPTIGMLVVAAETPCGSQRNLGAEL